jgi:hypothetical protein
MSFNICSLVWAGEHIMMMLDPGITSAGSELALFIVPTKSPLFSQCDLAVYALIYLLKTSGRLLRTLIFHLGLRWPMTAIEAQARLPPPAKVI